MKYEEPTGIWDYWCFNRGTSPRPCPHRILRFQRRKEPFQLSVSHSTWFIEEKWKLRQFKCLDIEEK